MHAALNGHLIAVQALYDPDNTGGTDKNGNTVRLCAAQGGDLEVIEWLFLSEDSRSLNYNPEERNDCGKNAFECAKLGEHNEVVEWFLKNFGD